VVQGRSRGLTSYQLINYIMLKTILFLHLMNARAQRGKI
jgi:hypothetical protein